MAQTVYRGAKPGPPPYLTRHEEEELASFLTRCAEIGFPKTRVQVLGLVQEIVYSKGLERSISNGWWEKFNQSQPHITLRAPMSLTHVRALASDHDVINRYYSKIRYLITILWTVLVAFLIAMKVAYL